MSHQRDRLLTIPGSRPDRTTDGSTVLRNEHGRRQTPDHKGPRHIFILIEQYGESDAQMIEKLFDPLWMHIRRDGHHLELRGIELRLESGQRWHFFFARSAPGRPKIKEDDLSSQFL